MGPVESTLSEQTLAELHEIAARYPQARSGLLPMLHLVQSARARSPPRASRLCAEILGHHRRRGQRGRDLLHDVQAQAGRRLPRRGLHQHAVRGDGRRRRSSSGSRSTSSVGNDETTREDDGTVTLEHIECNAACDYAPVMMVNWEFLDNMTPESAVDAGRRPARPARRSTPPAGPGCAPGARPSGCWPASPTGGRRGPAAGPPTLVGLGIARERGWTAPTPSRRRAGTTDGTSSGSRRPTGPTPHARRRSVERTTDADRTAQDRASSDVETLARSLLDDRSKAAEGQAMIDPLTPVLTDHWDAERSWTLETYESRGGYARAREGAGDGPDGHRRRGQGLRPARPRRRGLPHRA